MSKWPICLRKNSDDYSKLGQPSLDSSIEKPWLQAETPACSEAHELLNFRGFLRDPGLRLKEKGLKLGTVLALTAHRLCLRKPNRQWPQMPNSVEAVWQKQPRKPSGAEAVGSGRECRIGATGFLLNYSTLRDQSASEPVTASPEVEVPSVANLKHQLHPTLIVRCRVMPHRGTALMSHDLSSPLIKRHVLYWDLVSTWFPRHTAAVQLGRSQRGHVRQKPGFLDRILFLDGGFCLQPGFLNRIIRHHWHSQTSSKKVKDILIVMEEEEGVLLQRSL
ncbi:hypothetical protein C8F04DRAFT_1179296 [Mycena alexandri]|uniref:Uncharacterized protein n=1 Tax=Mycena alexandri TaxID=1745969 RepID=A0AAD6X8N2_9AGAR|nr:hypothetical protein C8F04DRAFT_1179296 [Mycena alexandri]